jgi:hypothetical protein
MYPLYYNRLNQEKEKSPQYTTTRNKNSVNGKTDQQSDTNPNFSLAVNFQFNKNPFLKINTLSPWQKETPTMKLITKFQNRKYEKHTWINIETEE